MRSNQWPSLVSLGAMAAVTAACSSGSSGNAPAQATLSISLLVAAVDDVTEVLVVVGVRELFAVAGGHGQRRDRGHLGQTRR